MRIAVCVYGVEDNVNVWWGDSPDVFTHSYKGFSRDGWHCSSSDRRPSDLDERAASVELYGHMSDPGQTTDHYEEFDSIRRVLLERRNHELSNNFDYDYVILTRPDLTTEGEIVFPEDGLAGEIVGDIRFSGASFGRRIIVGKPNQVDHMISMWNALHLLRSGVLTSRSKADPGQPDPDQLIHFYLEMTNVKMTDCGMKSLILRSPQYGLRACHGTPMRDYEVIG